MATAAASGQERASALLELRRRKERNPGYRTLPERYQDDPAGFGREVLGERFTEDVCGLMAAVRDNPVVIAKSGNAVGKCVAYGETIELADGRHVPAEALIGQSCVVWSVTPDLRPARAIAYATDNGEEEVVAITTSLGQRILRTLNHPLLSTAARFKAGETPVIGTPRWTPAGELASGDLVMVVEQSPVAGTATLPDEHVRLLAYLIGDGGLEERGVKFAQQDGPALDEFAADVGALGCHLVKVGGSETVDWRVTATRAPGTWGRNPVHDLLRSQGLWNKSSFDKRIPPAVWQLPSHQAAMFLSRLFATDGWAHAAPGKSAKDGLGRHEIGYCSVSRQLCEDVQWLLLRFGIVGRVREKRTTWTHRGEKRTGTTYCYEILGAEMCLRFCERIGIFGKEIAVEAVRKLASSKLGYKNRTWAKRGLPTGLRWEKVAHVERLGSRKTVAITVPGVETFLTQFVEHNTHAAARIAAWFYWVYPDAQVYTAAAPPENNLRNLLWGEIGGLTQRHPDVFAQDRKVDLLIARAPQSFIAGVSIPSSGTAAQREARFSGKHAPHLLFIVDEGDAVPPEVYRGIESCMSGGHARLLVMFNPRAEAGPVYQMERDGRAQVVELSALRHPNVVEGVDVIPGAVTREVTVRRINQWSRPLAPPDPSTGAQGERPDHECFEVPEYLVGAVAKALDGRALPPLPGGWRKVTEPALSYMVLGQYPTQATTQLISKAWIAQARARWDAYVATHGEIPPTGTQPIMGQDVAEFGQDSNVACFRWGGFVGRLESWRGVDTIVTGARAAELYKARRALACQVDATGVGVGVAPQMSRQGCRAIGVKVASSPTAKTELGAFGILRDQLWWEVREWLRADEGAMLPPDEELIEELGVPTYATDRGVVKVMAKDVMKEMLGRSPDKADALALTFAPLRSGIYI